MANREWALELADEYESGRRGWVKHVMARNIGEPGATRLCFCLLGGIANQAGVEVETECSCGREGCDLFEGGMNQLKMLENETYMLRSVQLGSYISGGTRTYDYTDDQIRDIVVAYNDDDGRTKEQVIAKLREFASAEQ